MRACLFLDQGVMLGSAPGLGLPPSHDHTPHATESLNSVSQSSANVLTYDRLLGALNPAP
ncbi:hypothetical protein PAAG_12470 [Paracoccidioides lutzii Pb01]|uniref:Uncharacterized protein n=1 Tax=Paracoccidioides lutzii (strain ATCC MYA-826 / Pb01) TaxID=502779 RepID=A0A0A2V012_PARBA|nr:hypothetical protein PAAG_12470 [Paracoccidioides lutzii Pb01]KGQ00843.1 hypothetical protein PAAG_12470 [Paracoccidioides lutzii Pb01]